MRYPEFRGRVAVVTGGASGIGAATARLLAAEGAKVAVADVDAAGLARMEATFRAAGHPFLGLRVDVADERQIAAMVEQTRAQLGEVDLLVNDAGISPKHQGRKLTVWEMPIEEWDRVMAVNIRGAFACCQAMAPGMIARRRGAIVNVSSMAAKVGTMLTGSHYVSSKAALVGLTKSLAREVAEYGIRVNAVAPGRIDTPMIHDVSPETNAEYERVIPLRRIGRADEVGEGILFLLSDAASYVTGHVMDINGGLGMFY
jgi:3-oxoacyl-[acyl-carrier protein] reductase